MSKQSCGLKVPQQAIVESWSEPGPELFAEHLPAMASLLRMALLSGMEMTLPTALQLVVDIAHNVVACDRQLLLFEPTHDEGARVQLGRRLNLGTVLSGGGNVLNEWVGHVGKPIVARKGMDPGLDKYLEHMEAQAAVAAPLYLQHGWVGSLQLFRDTGPEFSEAEARLLWILSLLAENKTAAIDSLQKLTQVAFTDYLTGLRARGYFERVLEQEVHRSMRRSSTLGLLLVDLDDFKVINDQFGHHAGDEVLRQFARLLPQGMRDVDTVSRFGGDEFAIILPDTSEAGVRLVVERMQRRLAEVRFSLPDEEGEVRLQASMGAALCPADEHSPDQLLRAADLALYHAKQQHKGQPYFWHELKRAS